jgi:hypothetical protein
MSFNMLVIRQTSWWFGGPEFQLALMLKSHYNRRKLGWLGRLLLGHLLRLEIRDAADGRPLEQKRWAARPVLP